MSVLEVISLCPHFTDNYKHTHSTVSIHYIQPSSQLGLSFVTAAPSTEATAPQDTFLPGVGVEGLAASSTEDTPVLWSDSTSSCGKLETNAVVWETSKTSILLVQSIHRYTVKTDWLF